jgi:fatty acid desaturase
MAGAAALIAASSPIGGAAGIALRLFGTLLVGFGLVTMGHCAQHECIHNTAFASRRLNALVAWMVSLPRLTNPRWERMLHKDHHTYTNDPNRDPEIMAGDPANSMPGDLWAYATKVKAHRPHSAPVSQPFCTNILRMAGLSLASCVTPPYFIQPRCSIPSPAGNTLL